MRWQPRTLSAIDRCPAPSNTSAQQAATGLVPAVAGSVGGKRRNDQARPILLQERGPADVVTVSGIKRCDQRPGVAQDHADAAPAASSRSGKVRYLSWVTAKVNWALQGAGQQAAGTSSGRSVSVRGACLLLLLPLTEPDRAGYISGGLGVSRAARSALTTSSVKPFASADSNSARLKPNVHTADAGLLARRTATRLAPRHRHRSACDRHMPAC